MNDNKVKYISSLSRKSRLKIIKTDLLENNSTIKTGLLRHQFTDLAFSLKSIFTMEDPLENILINFALG